MMERSAVGLDGELIWVLRVEGLGPDTARSVIFVAKCGRLELPMSFRIAPMGVSSISITSLFSNIEGPCVLRAPKVDAERCRLAILDERLAEGNTDTDRLKADKDGLGRGVDAEKQVDWDRGGLI